MVHLIFQPSGKQIDVKEDTTLLDAALRAGIHLEAACGGHGRCGKCRVVCGDPGNAETLSPPTAAERNALTSEELLCGQRLACEARARQNAVILVPSSSEMHRQVILEKGVERETACHPRTTEYVLSVPRPTLEDYRDDVTRVLDGMRERGRPAQQVTYEALCQLPAALREGKFTITCVRKDEDQIIGFYPGVHRQSLGIAVDIGTTTVAVFLCDLSSGALLGSDSFMNPQITCGDDVISRVSCIREEPEKLEAMRGALLDQMNRSIRKLTDRYGVRPEDIQETVLAGNTVMTCIALGLHPDWLGVSPFVSPASRGLDLTAKQAGLSILPGGLVHVLPGEAGFVGADNVAVLLSCEPFPKDQVTLVIDIGTNSEIDLIADGKIWCTSCATGPALEGAQISCGMRAADGAIDRVSIDPDSLKPSIHIIGGGAVPEGICGSGILDAVAVMAECGIIRPDGRFADIRNSPWLRRDAKGQMEYVLYRASDQEEKDITVKLADIRAVQLAKAALYAGASMLLHACGREYPDQIILAGAFGSFIDRDSALKLGLFSDCLKKNIHVVGNAAGTGARMALLNREKAQRAEELARSVTFIETAAKPDFRKCFADSMYIPHRTDRFTRNKPFRFPCRGTHHSVRPASDFRYQYQTWEELLEKGLPDEESLQKCILRMNRSGQPDDVADIPGAFALLASLVPPEQLYRKAGRNPIQFTQTLEKLNAIILRYAEKRLSGDVRILSFADPAGEMELCGLDFYRKFSGLANYRLFCALEKNLGQSLVHICGKTSVSMEKAGFMTAEPIRTEEGVPYLDILRICAADRKTHFIGHGCINREYPDLPLIYSMKLYRDRNASGRKEEKGEQI